VRVVFFGHFHRAVALGVHGKRHRPVDLGLDLRERLLLILCKDLSRSAVRPVVIANSVPSVHVKSPNCVPVGRGRAGRSRCSRSSRSMCLAGGSTADGTSRSSGRRRGRTGTSLLSSERTSNPQQTSSAMKSAAAPVGSSVGEAFFCMYASALGDSASNETWTLKRVTHTSVMRHAPE